jgi:transcriptional regulator with GAF, ATPase, and Fis domain
MNDETSSRSGIEGESGLLAARRSQERLAALYYYRVLDMPPEPAFDRITALVAWFFHAPMAAITLIDSDRVWFKSHHDLEPDQVSHEIDLWAAVILANDIYHITNAAEDPRTHTNTLVTGEFGLRFYAAAPLRNQRGHCLGSLCVIDRQPREITEREKEFLLRMAGVVMGAIELQLSALTRRKSTGEQDDGGIHEGGELEVPPHRPHIARNQLNVGRSEQEHLDWLAERILGDSPASRIMLDLVRLAITSQANSILLMGERGTGKSLCARTIHEGSGSRGRFVEINCGALTRELIDSELFGHEKGSFPGATDRRIGLFEQADGGTIFLDKITELTPDLQVKLLSVLEKRELRRIGGTSTIPISMRVIVATDRKIAEAIKAGSLRLDLFYRLGSWRIEIPPLRRRGDDIILLAHHFLASLQETKSRQVRGISHEAAILLKQYDWPGNIPQLMNVIGHAVTLEDSIQLSIESLRQALAISSIMT